MNVPLNGLNFFADGDAPDGILKNLPRQVCTVCEKHVCTSIIVAAELRYGADKKGSPRLSSQLDAVLGALEVLPFETPADGSYGLLRTRLEQAGHTNRRQ